MPKRPKKALKGPETFFLSNYSLTPLNTFLPTPEEDDAHIITSENILPIVPLIVDGELNGKHIYMVSNHEEIDALISGFNAI